MGKGAGAAAGTGSEGDLTRKIRGKPQDDGNYEGNRSSSVRSFFLQSLL